MRVKHSHMAAWHVSLGTYRHGLAAALSFGGNAVIALAHSS